MRSKAPRETVVDTMVLQKANAPLTNAVKDRSLLKKRLELLTGINAGKIVVLISEKLLTEYTKQIPSPRNDFIKAFFELIASERAITNWHKPWGSAQIEKAIKCRYPKEDLHVLRTAIRTGKKTYIVTEEGRLVTSSACILRKFRVCVIQMR